MAKERGVLQTVFKHFWASLKPQMFKRKLIGTDYYGTKYYEEPIASYSQRRRPSRSFVPVTKDDFEQELPAEWESWLRHRRKEPPSEEECLANYQMIITKRENAAKLDEEQRLLKLESGKDVPPRDDGPVKQELPSGRNFPIYKDYEDNSRVNK